MGTSKTTSFLAMSLCATSPSPSATVAGLTGDFGETTFWSQSHCQKVWTCAVGGLVVADAEWSEQVAAKALLFRPKNGFFVREVRSFRVFEEETNVVGLVDDGSEKFKSVAIVLNSRTQKSFPYGCL